tara:strand:- start:87 stop:512 length:426 start_codon:yes stop_codon:yes gene_type:complete
MKKTIFMLIAAVMLSCSSGSESNNNSNNNGANSDSITPPAWIQGLWLLQGVDEIIEIGYDIRNDDFCTYNSGMLGCYQEFVNMGQVNNSSNVYQEISSSRYYLQVVSMNQEYWFEFEKISDNQIAKTSITGNQEGIYTRID